MAQEAVDQKKHECAAILALLGRLDVRGALVTIDAVATNATVADAITAAGGDYLLALKRNQPTLHAEVARHFDDPGTTGLVTHAVVDKDRGRIETRTTTVSHHVDWLHGDRRHPGEPRFTAVKTLVRATTRVERRGQASEETRLFISSRHLAPEAAAEAVRSHWGVESLHWVLDVVFKEDQSRPRRGHGARNMALGRRLAFNLIRAGRGKRSIKTARKAAGWNTDFLASLIIPARR